MERQVSKGLNVDFKSTAGSISERFMPVEKLGAGSFGEIYRAYDASTGRDVAIKIEHSDSGRASVLQREAEIITHMQDNPGFPRMIHFADQKSQKVMVISLLGPDLAELFRFCRHKFTMKTVLMIADQCLTRIETLHSQGFVHRDIKPENFCVGPVLLDFLSELPSIPELRRIYLIDFGLSKPYVEDGNHIDYCENRGFVGTGRYMSLTANEGKEQSRRDDLESLGYMLVYFLKGTLPWQNLKIKDKKLKYSKILDMKRAVSIDKLTNGLPSEFNEYLRYCRALAFSSTPEYKYLRNLFSKLLLRLGYLEDMPFDWHLFKKKKQQEQKAATKPAKDQKQEAKQPSNMEAVLPIATYCGENLEDDAVEGQIRIQEIRLFPSRIHKSTMEYNHRTTHRASNISLQLPPSQPSRKFARLLTARAKEADVSPGFPGGTIKENLGALSDTSRINFVPPSGENSNILIQKPAVMIHSRDPSNADESDQINDLPSRVLELKENGVTM